MSKYVETSSGPIHEQDHGGDGGPIVLVHGLGGSTINWMAVAPRLKSVGRVTAIDLPGFGLTPPRANYLLSTHRDAVADYLRELTQPVTLVGASTGGLVSEMVASSYRSLVSRLILIAPATPPRLPDPRLHWPTVSRLVIQATPWVGRAVANRLVQRLSAEDLVRLTLGTVTEHWANVPLSLIEATNDLARLRRSMPWAVEATTRTANAVALSYTKRAKFISMIRQIGAPTLVVQGFTDPIVSPTAIEWLCRLRPDWELLQMEGTGHTPYMDAPVRLGEAMVSWFADNAEKSAAASPESLKTKV